MTGRAEGEDERGRDPIISHAIAAQTLTAEINAEEARPNVSER